MVEQDIPPTSQLPSIPGLPFRDSRQALHDVLSGVGLSLLVFVLYLLPSQWRALEETAEARVAVVAREMIKTDDWVVPRIGSEPRLKKPPLPYWMVAAAAGIFGEDEKGRHVSVMAAVLPSAMLGSLCVFMIVLFGAHVFGRAAGLWAGIILGLSLMFSRFSQLGTGEIILTFFTTAALLSAAWVVCMPRPGFFSAILLGCALGLAILSKWHVPVLIVCGALIVDVCRRPGFDLRKTLLLVLSLVLAVIVVLPWCLAVRSQQPEAASVMWAELMDAVRVSGHDQDDRWFYYIYQFAGGLLPWTPLLLIAWPVGWSRIRSERAASNQAIQVSDRMGSFLAGAVVIGFLGFYVVAKQQYHYLLPLMPATALVAGNTISRLDQPGGVAEEGLAWAHMLLGTLLGIGIAICPIWLEQMTLGVSIPLGILTIILSLVASRQWVEGNPLSAGLSLGLAAYAVLIGWTLITTLDKADESDLIRQSENLLKKLEGQPESSRLYTVRTGIPKECLLYYLDRENLYGRNDLLKEGDGSQLPENAQAQPRFLICGNDVASFLGYGSSDESPRRLHIFYVTPTILEQLKNLPPKASSEEPVKEESPTEEEASTEEEVPAEEEAPAAE